MYRMSARLRRPALRRRAAARRFRARRRRDAGGDRARAAGARLARLSEQPDRQPVRRGATSSAIVRAAPGPGGGRRGLPRVRRRELPAARARVSQPGRRAHRVEDRHGRRCAWATRSRRPAWIAEIDKVRPPYNVNALTQAAAPVLLEHGALLAEQAARDPARARARCTRRCARCPASTVFPTQANFVLVRVPDAPRWFERAAATRAYWSRTCTARIRCSPTACASPSARRTKTTRVLAALARYESIGSPMPKPRTRQGRAQHQGDADRASRSTSTAPAAPSSRPACRSSTTCSTRSRATA